ncbi:VWA domain-containing protein [Corynebacterium sp. 335C]
MGLTPEDACAAWLAAPRGGILLTGDAAAAGRLFRELRSRVPHVAVSPSMDAADGERLAARARAEARAGGGARRPVVAVGAADAMADAGPAAVPPGRVLAFAADPAEVPSWLLRRCALLVHVPRVVDPAVTRSLVDDAAPALPDVSSGAPRPEEAVALLAKYGIADHDLDADAAVLAGLSGPGWDGAALVAAYVVAPRVGEPPEEIQPPEPAPAPEHDDRPEDERERDDAPRDDRPDDRGDDRDREGRERDGERDGRRDDRAPSDDVDAAAPPPPRRAGRARDRRPWPGRRGALQDGADHGRVVRRTRWREGLRLDVPATLAAAAPWQPARRAATGRDGLVLDASDLRAGVRASRGAGLAILVVDASGSMGRGAIRAAKATAMAILDEGYRRRDRVAIVVARGPEAVIGLPPTRSMSRARDCLRALPVGGGTPLASGLLAAAELAAKHDPERVRVLLLTDGRANVALSDGGDPRADAVRALGVLRGRCGDVAVIPLASRSRRRRGDPTAWLTGG